MWTRAASALELVQEALGLEAAVEQQLCPRLLLLLPPLQLHALLLQDDVDVNLHQIQLLLPARVLGRGGERERGPGAG